MTDILLSTRPNHHSVCGITAAACHKLTGREEGKKENKPNITAPGGEEAVGCPNQI